jgi:SpoVK/Ycf46/Vps4 family AAA+-type ATPase
MSSNCQLNFTHASTFKVHCCKFTAFIVQASAGYSGSDIKLVCKEAAMNVVRDAFSVLETCQNGKYLPYNLHLTSSYLM